MSKTTLGNKVYNKLSDPKLIQEISIKMQASELGSNFLELCEEFNINILLSNCFDEMDYVEVEINDNYIEYFIKDIKRFNKKSSIKEFILAFVYELVHKQLAFEIVDDTIEFFNSIVSPQFIEEYQEDWFRLALDYDLTGGEPKDWYEMSEELNLSDKEKKN